jgi:NodT family efflux transporter outer membrane factor (OMF) lipoprotein
VFNDPVLNGLAEQVAVSNQNLAAAEARYRQARAAVTAARAGYFPTVGASAGASRSRRGEGATASSYDIGLDASWEIDLWGRVRRLVEASRAGEEASAADLENARLSLQAQLVTAYFQVRVADAGADLLDDTVKANDTSFKIAQNRYDAGVAAKVDVVQAEGQLRSVQAQVLDLRATRAQLEHAVAVLIGKPPAAFSLAPTKFEMKRLPDIPPGLPSTLLERRPDVAAAERRMAQANARVGVAQAAYFPALSLSGSGGFASSSLSTLISAPSRAWALGAGLGVTLLDFGARGAQVDIARAAYDESVANYRQSVLDAFQEVEDNLAVVHWLGEETGVQRESVRLARESVALTMNQYRAGTVGFLNVALVQAAQLNEERQLVVLVGRRITATVTLIRALGGSW